MPTSMLRMMMKDECNFQLHAHQCWSILVAVLTGPPGLKKRLHIMGMIGTGGGKDGYVYIKK